jgi:CBS domain containing-hemolysin-like protein
MTSLQTALWYVAAAAGLVGSAMFSGLETGLYTINRIRLHMLAHVPRSNAAVLESLIAKPNRVLGTLLVANNTANYLASLAVGALLDDAGYEGWSQVMINSAILMPILFVFGEVLPKDFFRSHTDTITPPFARPLLWGQRLLTWIGLLPLIDSVGWGVQRFLHGSRSTTLRVMHPRRTVTELIKEGVGHGVISQYQSAMIDRVLELQRMTVRDVLKPWSQATLIRTTQPAEAVWAIADRVSYTRAPLVAPDGTPVGILDLYDVLRHDPATCPPLTDLADPLVSLSPDMPLAEALRTCQQQRASMAVIFDAAGKPLGLVTTKELVEPIIGEIDVW